MTTPLIIDWADPKAKIGQFFTVHDALYLPSWKIYHIPSKEEQLEIFNTCLTMDNIRNFLNKPCAVNCWIRPNKVNAPGTQHHEQDYNKVVNGAQRSAHIIGAAVDFRVPGMDANDVRKALVPKIDEFKFRMEDHKGPWCHIDTLWKKNGNNYFPI
jgi:Peptidase M15